MFGKVRLAYFYDTVPFEAPFLQNACILDTQNEWKGYWSILIAAVCWAADLWKWTASHTGTPQLLSPFVFAILLRFSFDMWYLHTQYLKKNPGKASKSEVQLSCYSSHLTGKSYLGFRSFWESEWNKFSPVLLYMFQARSWKVNLYVHFVTNVFSENANP